MNFSFRPQTVTLGIICLQIGLSVITCFYFPGIQFAIVPRQSPLWTLLTGPIVHADWQHLSGNLEVFVPVVSALFLMYERYATIMYFSLYLISSLLLWVFGSYNAHLGLSGVIIALTIYVVLSGFFSLEWSKILVSLLISAIYYAVITQFYVSEPGVSIDAHICGFLAGFIIVFVQYFPRESFRFR